MTEPEARRVAAELYEFIGNAVACAEDADPGFMEEVEQIVATALTRAAQEAREAAMEEAATMAEQRCLANCARLDAPPIGGAGPFIIHSLGCDEGKLAAALRQAGAPPATPDPGPDPLDGFTPNLQR